MLNRRISRSLMLLGVASALALSAGCANRELRELAEQASQDAQAAQQTASAAQQTANQALSEAQAASAAAAEGNRCCEDLELKLERALERMQQK